MKNRLPTKEYLNERLSYDPETGILRWKMVSTRWGMRPTDRVAGTKASGGDCSQMMVDNTFLKAHRVIWRMVHGDFDEQLVIDHINGDRGDNRISNLRLVTHQENMKNCSLSKNNTTGHTGIWYQASTDKWHASIHKDYKKVHIGSYKTKGEAIKARKDAEKELGFHSNHGRV